MGDISEDVFNEIMDKLMATIEAYENNFRELTFLKEEINGMTITAGTRLDYLQRINDWTREVASRSYVIRFIHHRLEDDVEDAAAGFYRKNRHPVYLEFAF